MSTPAADAVATLEAFVAPYVVKARNADAATCRSHAQAHARMVDDALYYGDLHAAALHSHLAVLYRAHELTALAADLIANHDHDPMEQS